MEYGLIVSNEQLKVLDKNSIEYTFWDGYDLFSEESKQVENNRFEILFDTEEERQRARNILK